MKKAILLLGIISLTSCGSVNRSVFGLTEENLIKTVSIEQDCEIENITVKDKIQGLHGATYALDVCGERMIYKQIGSVFMEASQADKTIEDLKKG